jgi:hypothetical protein
MRYARLEGIEVSLDAMDVVRWLREQKHVPEDFKLSSEHDYVEWPIKLKFERVTPDRGDSEHGG